MITGLKRWVNSAAGPKVGRNLRPSYFQRLKVSLQVAMQDELPVLPREYLTEDLHQLEAEEAEPEVIGNFTFE